MVKTRQKIVELLQQGRSRSQIAQELGITSQAVRYHQQKIKHGDGEWNKEKPRPRFVRQWRQYNDTLVRRGEAILDLDVLKDEQQELKGMNQQKVGRPYRYSESLLQLLFVLRIAFKLDYRTLEGVGRKILFYLSPGHQVPDYTTIQDRFEKTEQQLQVHYEQACGQEVAIDSTGRSIGERGTYRESHYQTPYRKFLKLSVSVNVQTRQVVAVETSSANEHDVVAFPKLIVQSQSVGPVRRALADRAYDSEKNIQELQRQGIQPVIRPKAHKNPQATQREYEKTLKRLEQTKDFEKQSALLARKFRYESILQCQDSYPAWRDRTQYGQRAMVEGHFSRETRIFGDTVRSRKSSNIRKELLLRCNLLNLFAHMSLSTAGKAQREEPPRQPVKLEYASEEALNP